MTEQGRSDRLVLGRDGVRQKRAAPQDAQQLDRADVLRPVMDRAQGDAPSRLRQSSSRQAPAPSRRRVASAAATASARRLTARGRARVAAA